jgi:hypothetical protein
MNRCKKCLLPEGTFNVVFNASGICNYCEHYEQNKKAVLDFTGREDLLARKLERHKGKYEYDALVGLSGGKDSTYVLCQMVDKYKLNVAAVTYDNGFLTDFAKESVKNTISQLGVDHYYYKPDWDTHKKFYRATIQKVFDPCIACSIGGYFLAIKKCYERQFPFFVHGRSPYQMYRNFYKNSNDMFLTMMRLNLMDPAAKPNFGSFLALLKSIPFKSLLALLWRARGNGLSSDSIHRYAYGKINEYIHQIISKIAESQEDAEAIMGEFFDYSDKINQKLVPEFLAYFLFEEYDEEKIKKYLENRLGWKRPARDSLLGHYDCALHDAAAYMYKELNGVDMIEPDAAVMLRFGKISQEKANKLVQANQPTEEGLEKSLDALCNLFDFNREDLEKILVALKQAKVSKFGSR